MTDARDGPLGIRKHQCEHCPKSFKRREHWQRHSRSHTNEKPFECRYCHKCFARRDLVTRHEKTLHANDGSPNGSPTASVRRPSTAVANNDPSPSIAKTTARDIVSPNADEIFDGLSPLATTVPATDHLTQATPNFDSYAPPANNGFEDFLDPALRAQNEVGGDWGWTATQSSHEVNFPPTRQAAETPVTASSSATTLGKTEQTYATAIPETVIENLLSHGPGPSLINDTPPPSADLVRICLAAYFEAFNIHLPLIHQPTFDYTREPPQLLLAMAAIGALYRLERKVATYLYLAAETRFPNESFVSDETCADLFYAGDLASPDEAVADVQSVNLADARTLLLLMLFGAFSGNREVSETAIGRQGRIANAYHSIARIVRRENQVAASPLSWLDRVQTRASTSIPAWHLGMLQFFDGRLWYSASFPVQKHYGRPTRNQWRALVGTVRTPPTIKAAVELLGSNDESALADLAPNSGLAVVILMHAFSVHVWHSANSVGGSGSPDVLNGLSACRGMLLERGGLAITGTILPRPNFLFNASAVSRIAYSRSESALTSIDRSAMLRGDAEIRLNAIRHYIEEPLPRTPAVLAAVTGVFENFVFTNRGGTLLIRKTAGLAWSFEHMISAWDSVLLLTKWLQETTHDATTAEQALRDHISTML